STQQKLLVTEDLSDRCSCAVPHESLSSHEVTSWFDHIAHRFPPSDVPLPGSSSSAAVTEALQQLGISAADTALLRSMYGVVVLSALVGPSACDPFLVSDVAHFATASASPLPLHFVLFLDRACDAFPPHSSTLLGWRLIRMDDFFFPDSRRSSRFPKIVPHVLFPAAHFSLWVDAKVSFSPRTPHPFVIVRRLLMDSDVRW
ncbi:MAG: DUF616 domain-containing protein, partial [Prosthecobacter sp.]|nr:DUF616 domain-containing protein [Prosthecobacter sp.]